jgi:hypothetical protein
MYSFVRRRESDIPNYYTMPVYLIAIKGMLEIIGSEGWIKGWR